MWPAMAPELRIAILSFRGNPLKTILNVVLGSGTHLKSFLDQFRFILTRSGVKRTHGDPIRVHFYDFL